MAQHPIFLDYNSTAPCDPRVVAAMLPFFSERFGNPASRTHAFGRGAEEAVTAARRQVASLLNCEPPEIIWTSGATEADNLAIKGVAEGHRLSGQHIVTQATEHHAVLDPCKRLLRAGYRVTVLPVDGRGRVSADQVASAVGKDTILVSIMWANNETGMIQPIHEIGRAIKDKNPETLFHTDATQAVGRIPVDVQASSVDLLSASSHKLGGPKGCGALYVRRRRPSVHLEAIIDGGGHERGLRSGTLNVPGIVGFGAACDLAAYELAGDAARLKELRDRLWAGFSGRLCNLTINGDPELTLPNTLNIAFHGISAESLLLAIGDEIALSAGSACTSASLEPSHVLRAMGIPDDVALGSVRFSLGRFSTEEEIGHVVEKVSQAVGHLRSMSEERLSV